MYRIDAGREIVSEGDDAVFVDRLIIDLPVVRMGLEVRRRRSEARVDGLETGRQRVVDDGVVERMIGRYAIFDFENAVRHDVRRVRGNRR